MSGKPPAIQARGVAVELGHERILTSVDLVVEPGEFVGVAGPNGGGKSTLLRALLGLVPTKSGTVHLFGAPVHEFRDHVRIGYLAQHAAHVEHGFPATCREVVAMGLTATRRWPWQRARGGRAAIDEAMTATGVLALGDKRIDELSGGQRQRVLLARALVARPDLLVLDEPTTGVDPKARDAFAHLLQDINRARGTTILLVSHDDDLLHHAAHRLVVVDRRIVSDTASDPIQSSLGRLHGGHA